MRWANYLAADGRRRTGLVQGESIFAVPGLRDLSALLGDDGETMAAAADLARSDPADVISLADATFVAPLPIPPSIRDFMGFEEHVANCRSRTGQGVDSGWYERPVFYFTNPAAVHPPDCDVLISPGSSAFDYELEVAAVIGRGGSNLHPEEAENHIAGFMVLCDWSARDLQREEMQSRLGPAKGKDSATSFGQFLVTPDELADRKTATGYDLSMSATVNGQLYSSGNWSAVHWSFGQMLAYASRGTQLRTGDVLGSGAVGRGCILELSILHGEENYPWLQPGDEVVCAVERLGHTVGHIGEAPAVVSLTRC